MIRINNLTKIYNKGKANEFKALDNINLEIANGEMTAVIGKSGAGKSTLLHILACIDSYEGGEYYIDGTLTKNLNDRKLSKLRNNKIGLIMQDFALCSGLTCFENVMLPLYFRRESTKKTAELSKNALVKVGLERQLNKPVTGLSGGQKQRTAIARTLAQNPSVILADEPTGALDKKTSDEIISLFEKINHEGHTVVIVTHDLEIAHRCGRIIEISDGKLL